MRARGGRDRRGRLGESEVRARFGVRPEVAIVELLHDARLRLTPSAPAARA
jgi:hypothetical protein